MTQRCLEPDATLGGNEFETPPQSFSNPRSPDGFMLPGVPAEASLLSWWSLQSPYAELLEEKRQGKAELPGDSHSADAERGSADGWCIANYKMQIWHFQSHINHSHRHQIDASTESVNLTAKRVRVCCKNPIFTLNLISANIQTPQNPK